MTVEMNRLFSYSRRVVTVAMALLPLALASCSSSRKAAEAVTVAPAAGSPVQTDAKKALSKVYQARVTEQNLTADLNLTITYGDNEISAPGSLHMRRDEMIRLQVFMPILGTEIGRVELTPTTVTIIDRLHKQYMRRDYSDVDFLARNGLSFYSLQSLFWNQVFVPGRSSTDLAALQTLTASTDAAGSLLNLSCERGETDYSWAAKSSDGTLLKTIIAYSGGSDKAAMTWAYDKFKAMGSKQYPSLQTISIDVASGNMKRSVALKLKLSSIDNSSKWSTATELSKKYKEVTSTEVIRKLFGK